MQRPAKLELVPAVCVYNGAMSSEHKPRAFFGRRKGHPLRPRQAALFETLLPRLALDLGAGASRPAHAISRYGRPCAARDRLRRRRAPDRAGASQSAHRLHRHRAVRQRHGQGAGGDRRRASSATSGCITAMPPTCWPGCRRLARARRSALSRSVAETAALEAALRAGRQRRRDRAHPAAGRRIPLRHRYCRLRGLDAGARCCVRPISPGPPSAPTTGGSPGRAFPARATRPRPSAKAACRAI